MINQYKYLPSAVMYGPAIRGAPPSAYEIVT
jgi:hypothetical protein